MDSLGVVAEVVYAGLDEVEFRNLSVVPGKHEAYLNSAIHAHKRGLVDDWIEFFRGEWTSVLYMDSFSSLVTALKRSLQNDKGMIMLLSRIFEKSETTLDDSEVDEYRRILLGAHGELIPEITKRTAEAESMEYLREHKDFLPKYYMPSAKGEA